LFLVINCIPTPSIVKLTFGSISKVYLFVLGFWSGSRSAASLAAILAASLAASLAAILAAILATILVLTDLRRSPTAYLRSFIGMT
jgi:hypothetical protein